VCDGERIVIVVADYRWDNFRLDLDAYRLERDGAPLPLEPKAFNLLALMIQRPNHLFSKPEIFAAVWPDTAVTDHALTRVVAQLRRTLGDEVREARYIETVPTRGYRWIRPVEPCASTVIRSEPPLTLGLRDSVPEVPNAASSTATPHRSGAIAALVALGLTALAVWAVRQSGPRAGAFELDPGAVGWRAEDLARPVQVTTHDGLELNPAVSPQGDALAYSSDRTGTLELYVRGVGGADSESPLTSDGGQNVQPAWSPDGRLIAYHSNRLGGIWIVPARGGAPRQVAPSGSNPAWSPDGRRIAFQSDENTDVTPSAYGAQSGSTIWTVDTTDGRLTPLTHSGAPMGGHAAPAWSHDGRYLAFTVFEGGADDGAWVLTIDSATVRPLSTGSALYEVAFAPDDRSLFAAGGEAFIVRMPFDPAAGEVHGRRDVIAVPGVPGVRGLSIGGGGRSIAFAGLALSSQIWRQPIDRQGAAQGTAVALTRDTSRRNSFAAVSPDGRRIAYISTRNGDLPNVWMMDLDGGNRVQLTADDTGELRPSWLPDGRRVAYTSYRGETRGVFAVDLATRREELLFDLAETPFLRRSPPLRGRLAEVQLSPSSMRAAFALVTRPESRRVLYVTNVGDLQPRAISDGSRSIGYPAWAPDEQRIAVEIKDGSSTHAGVVDVRSGVLRQLTFDRGQTWVRSWSPDGRKIAAATLRDGLWRLSWIDAQSGQRHDITPQELPRVYVRYPEWSAKNDAILFERGELRGNIWVLPLAGSKAPKDAKASKD
jgi:Tol biopolymer transport system component/DNA-binding winged helix-turn-helix (wHTH) protein